MIGIRPGPLIFESNADMVWGFVGSFFVGNIFLAILNVLLVGFLIKILDIPSKTLFPIILALAFIGTYTLNYSVVDFYFLIIFGLVGLFMKILDFPVTPLILAIIVGKN